MHAPTTFSSVPTSSFTITSVPKKENWTAKLKGRAISYCTHYSLSKEVLCLILTYLTPQEWQHTCLVNWGWHIITKDACQEVNELSFKKFQKLLNKTPYLSDLHNLEGGLIDRVGRFQWMKKDYIGVSSVFNFFVHATSVINQRKSLNEDRQNISESFLMSRLGTTHFLCTPFEDDRQTIRILDRLQMNDSLSFNIADCPLTKSNQDTFVACFPLSTTNCVTVSLQGILARWKVQDNKVICEASQDLHLKEAIVLEALQIGQTALLKLRYICLSEEINTKYRGIQLDLHTLSFSQIEIQDALQLGVVGKWIFATKIQKLEAYLSTQKGFILKWTSKMETFTSVNETEEHTSWIVVQEIGKSDKIMETRTGTIIMQAKEHNLHACSIITGPLLIRWVTTNFDSVPYIEVIHLPTCKQLPFIPYNPQAFVVKDVKWHEDQLWILYATKKTQQYQIARYSFTQIINPLKDKLV